jgi:hypothetical protein
MKLSNLPKLQKLVGKITFCEFMDLIWNVCSQYDIRFLNPSICFEIEILIVIINLRNHQEYSA